MTSRDDAFAKEVKDAREYASKVLGYGEPKKSPAIEALKAAALVVLPPLLGLPFFGVSMDAIEVPLLVLGLVTGGAVYWHYWRRRNRWYSAYAERLVRKS
jgi:hypothetical protein